MNAQKQTLQLLSESLLRHCNAIDQTLKPLAEDHPATNKHSALIQDSDRELFALLKEEHTYITELVRKNGEISSLIQSRLK